MRVWSEQGDVAWKERLYIACGQGIGRGKKECEGKGEDVHATLLEGKHNRGI